MKTWILGSLVGLLMLLAVMKLFFFEVYFLNGDEMMPRVSPGQWLLVSKLDRTPERDALVLLMRPGQQTPSPSPMIRRVIGLPGDRITFVHGALRIHASSTTSVRPPNVIAVTRVPSWLAKHRTQASSIELVLDAAYFVVADNPKQATDSRTFGPVPASAILGTVRAP